MERQKICEECESEPLLPPPRALIRGDCVSRGICAEQEPPWVHLVPTRHEERRKTVNRCSWLGGQRHAQTHAWSSKVNYPGKDPKQKTSTRGVRECAHVCDHVCEHSLEVWLCMCIHWLEVGVEAAAPVHDHLLWKIRLGSTEHLSHKAGRTEWWHLQQTGLNKGV